MKYKKILLKLVGEDVKIDEKDVCEVILHDKNDDVLLFIHTINFDIKNERAFMLIHNMWIECNCVFTHT